MTDRPDRRAPAGEMGAATPDPTVPHTGATTAESAEPAIVFDRVHKTFDSLKVIDDLSLAVGAGQIVGIVGPSGVGKTTILKLITGIVTPDRGTVTVAEGRLGYVFQEPRLLPWRTASDNVAVALRAMGMEKAAARAAAAGWLERVGLEGFEDYHPDELSGGMAQRVSIARAFAVEPGILLLDEPFSNMDATLKASLMDVLRGMLEERRITVIHVTHDLTEVLQWADRIIELTADHRARELDLTDRKAVAMEWLAATLRRLGV
jgi:NitT/TauT family transport system ATP-binding protein